MPGSGSAGQHAPAYGRHDPPPASMPGTAAQQAFIGQVAPGAIAAQQRYGIPASVTIAQAIDESGWGQSELATADHNLFGIKGTGPAGRDMQPTQEYENGIWVTRTAPFRVYHNLAESIADHGQLLATNPVYQHAMANRQVPDAFADALTGVYATDPNYGPNLIALMRLYNLYRYDSATPARRAFPGARGGSRRGEHSRGGGRGGGRDGAGAPGAPDHAGGGAAAGTADRVQGFPASARRYVPQIPQTVTSDFVATAKAPLVRAQPLYQDVADRNGIPWELLAACDWMQCRAHPRYSPVHGEKLGTANPDGTVFRTKSAALAQCASELIELADAVVPDRPDRRAATPVGPRAGQGVRRVPVGRAAPGAWHLGHGVPVLGRGPDRPAPQDALARHQRAARAGQAGHAIPHALRCGSRGAQPRLPCRGLAQRLLLDHLEACRKLGRGVAADPDVEGRGIGHPVSDRRVPVPPLVRPHSELEPALMPRPPGRPAGSPRARGPDATPSRGAGPQVELCADLVGFPVRPHVGGASTDTVTVPLVVIAGSSTVRLAYLATAVSLSSRCRTGTAACSPRPSSAAPGSVARASGCARTPPAPAPPCAASSKGRSPAGRDITEQRCAAASPPRVPGYQMSRMAGTCSAGQRRSRGRPFMTSNTTGVPVCTTACSSSSCRPGSWNDDLSQALPSPIVFCHLTLRPRPRLPLPRARSALARNSAPWRSISLGIGRHVAAEGVEERGTCALHHAYTAGVIDPHPGPGPGPDTRQDGFRLAARSKPRPTALGSRAWSRPAAR